MKKAYILPPLAPVGALLLFGAYVYVSERLSVPRIIDGQIDNAPLRASMIIPFFVPFLYLFFAGLNGIEAWVELRLRNKRFLSPLIMTFITGMILFIFLYRPSIDEPSFIPNILMMSLVFAAILIVPMSLWRKRLRK